MMRVADMVRLIALAAIWGGSFLFIRLIVPVLGALPAAFFRVVFGATGLLLILAVLRIKFDFKGRLAVVMVLGIVNSGIPFVMYSFAAKVLPAGYSAILNATTPLMGVLIGAMFFSDKLTLAKAMGVLIGLVGVAVLTSTGPVQINQQVLMGAAACLLATACYGLAGFLTRRWITEKGGLDAKLVALGSQLGAVSMLAPLFLFSLGNQSPVSWGGSSVWAALAALGLVCTALAYILYFRLIADIGPVKALTVTFLIPPFGVLWGALFLGEQVTWAHAAGAACIGLAVWLVLKPAAPASAVLATRAR